ncbi:hypothetical protein LIER_16449 [Lithospermum erythrorhizon]|uniref:Uncharacterized protein n=1 Tax=Lithospermum erythrorhizon TaxID=34254 RepID=A0AAV3Q9W7_LITER
MKGKRIPLFKRGGVVTKTAPETSAPASAGSFSTALGKRPSDPTAPPKTVLTKRTKKLKLGMAEKSKLGMALDALRATRPLLLEGIGKPDEEFIHPLELEGVIAKHLVKAMNTSHVLARRVDHLDVDLGLSRVGERAS